MLYYALTSNMVWDLGLRESAKDAENYAVNQFNIHQAPNGYVVLNFRELEAIKNLLEKRGVGIY